MEDGRGISCSRACECLARKRAKSGMAVGYGVQLEEATTENLFPDPGYLWNDAACVDGDQEMSVPLNEGNKWFRCVLLAVAILMWRGQALGAERLTLHLVVTPSTVIVKDG